MEKLNLESEVEKRRTKQQMRNMFLEVSLSDEEEKPEALKAKKPVPPTAKFGVGAHFEFNEEELEAVHERRQEWNLSPIGDLSTIKHSVRPTNNENW